MFLLGCRTSEVCFQDILNLRFINLIIKSGDYTTKVIARVIVSGKLIVDDVEGVFSHEHIVDVDIVMTHGVFDPVHIRILLKLAEHDPFLLKDFEQVALHLGCFLEETLTLPYRVIIVLFPIRKVISFLVECTNLSGNPLHYFNIFIVLTVQVDTVLAELGNLGTLLVDVDVCIICVSLGCKFVRYAFILSVDKELCAVSRIAEDITFSTDNKCEENVGKSLLQDIDIADFIFVTVEDGANLLVDPAGNISKEQTVDVLDFLNGIKLKQEVGRILRKLSALTKRAPFL